MSQIKFSTRLFLTPGEKVEVTRLLLESLEIPFTTSRGAGIVRLIEGSSSFISGYFESQHKDFILSLAMAERADLGNLIERNLLTFIKDIDDWKNRHDESSRKSN